MGAGEAIAAPAGNSAMWGTSLRQRLRLMPLFLATCVADAVAPLLRARTRRHELWQRGISVLIPERDAPALLGEALDAASIALAQIAEPYEIVVMVNGATPARYDALRARHPGARFLFHDAPLGFARAVAAGLAAVRHDWTLLLNNDMRLAPDAVAALARHRAPDVFAIAAEILQRSVDGRREETGFTDWYADGDGVHLFHAPVPATSEAVPHVCASGGAALFRTSALRRYVPASLAYDPFYWEDAEWSVRAWRDGWRVLFTADARAEHRHRATTSRFYALPELERIVERNRLLLDARQRITAEPRASLLRRICDRPYATQRELAAPALAAGVLAQRIHARRAPQPCAPPVLWTGADEGVRLASSSYSYRLRGNAATERPRLLVVTPFAIFPPRHGGARRVTELLRTLRQDYDVTLVSDEPQLYDARSFAFFDGLSAVYLVRGREPAQPAAPQAIDVRMRAHAHPALVQSVRRALQEQRPSLVQIEHAELASLVELRQARERWVLGLHDACGASDFSSPEAFGAFERDMLARFDAVTVCSDADAVLVRHPRVVCVPNGSTVRLQDYRPSRGRRLLFVGPFRYAPNVTGISAFLRHAYPLVLARVPDVELVVLGGDEGVARTRDDPLFRQSGVTVLGHRDDVPRLLSECTMTINPQTAIRGSAVKLVESLSAGRVCVSTDEGARGFDVQGFAGLLAAADVPAMAQAIVELLLDPAERHRREAPDPQRLGAYQWPSCAGLQHDLYARLLTTGEECP